MYGLAFQWHIVKHFPALHSIDLFYTLQITILTNIQSLAHNILYSLGFSILH